MADLVGARAYYRWGSYRKYSTQQLVDCTYKKYYYGYLNSGCDGGLTYYNAWYAVTNGLTLESNYPYRTSNGYCRINSGEKPDSVYYRFKGCFWVNFISKYVPGAIRFYVTRNFYDMIRFYKGGVYHEPVGSNCPSNLKTNHAMLAVGNGPNYIKIKNSWGTYWGENGYGKIKKG